MDLATFNRRFDFLTPVQRYQLYGMWVHRTVTLLPSTLEELVRALADEIDSAAEMARIDKMTPDEVDAELRALGADPEKIRKHGEELRARLTAQLSQR